jgi:peptide-methionine (S)-S-oxide reductase
MKNNYRRIAVCLGFIALLVWGAMPARAVTLPDPALDQVSASGSQSIVLAGGCFWGMQAVFQHVKGVSRAISGYAGGAAETAHYEEVSTGTTGHAESVQVTYDPSQITLGQILKVYFSVAHDPTELNRQGPDTGMQYRSAIFVSTPEQQKIALAYIAQLQQTKVFAAPIVTAVEPLKGFYKAENHHQDFYRLHPNNRYIVINDRPKVAALRQEFPQLYIEP